MRGKIMRDDDEWIIEEMYYVEEFWNDEDDMDIRVDNNDKENKNENTIFDKIFALFILFVILTLAPWAIIIVIPVVILLWIANYKPKEEYETYKPTMNDKINAWLESKKYENRKR